MTVVTVLPVTSLTLAVPVMAVDSSDSSDSIGSDQQSDSVSASGLAMPSQLSGGNAA